MAVGFHLVERNRSRPRVNRFVESINDQSDPFAASRGSMDLRHADCNFSRALGSRLVGFWTWAPWSFSIDHGILGGFEIPFRIPGGRGGGSPPLGGGGSLWPDAFFWGAWMTYIYISETK